MEGSTDRGFFGLGHKKEEDKHQHQQQGTHPGSGTHEGHQETGTHTQQQHTRPEHGHGEQHTTPMVGTYSAAPGIPPPVEGEGEKKPGFMEKLEGKLGLDKAKKGHKKGEKKEGGHSSSSSSDEDESGEKKKKHGIF